MNLNITWIALCSCGAVTFTVDGNEYSLPKDKFEKEYGNLDVLLKAIPDQEEIQEFCNCNYCVNHWGLDLCACGSGDKIGECENDLDCCGAPSQILETGQICYKAKDSWI